MPPACPNSVSSDMYGSLEEPVSRPPTGLADDSTGTASATRILAPHGLHRAAAPALLPRRPRGAQLPPRPPPAEHRPADAQRGHRAAGAHDRTAPVRAHHPARAAN